MKSIKLVPPLGVIVILAIVVRLYSLIFRPWNADEFWTFYWIKNDIKTIVWGSFADFRPPLYYLAVLGWQHIVGDTLTGLRFFSFFTSLATLYFFYRLTKFVSDNVTAYWAILIASISAGFVVDATDGRMFALGTLSTVVVLWSILAYIQTHQSKYLIFNTVALLVAIYTYHYLTLLVISVWLMVVLKKSFTRNFLVSQTVLFILAIPFFYLFYQSVNYLTEFHQYLSGNLFKPLALLVVPFLPAELFLGVVHKPDIGQKIILYSGVIIVFFGALVAKVLLKARKIELLTFICFTLVPLGVLFISSLIVRPIIGIHSLIFFTPPIILLIAKSIRHSRLLQICTMAMVIFSTVYYFLSFPILRNDSQAFKFLNDNYQNNDLVLVENIYPLLWSRYFSGVWAKSLNHSPHNQAIERALGYEVIPIESISQKRVFLIQENLFTSYLRSKNMLLNHSYVITNLYTFPNLTISEYTKKT